METTNGAATTAARECHDWRESHEHNRSCGPCKECRGTGKDLISYIFRSKKTRAKCPVCKGTRIRSQEFELSNQLTMEDLIEDMYLLIQSDFEEVMAEYAMIHRSLATDLIKSGDGEHLCVDRADDDDNDTYWEMRYDLIEGKYVEKFEYVLDEWEQKALYEEHYSSFEEYLQLEKEYQQLPVFRLDQILDLNDEDQLDLYLHLLSIEDELVDESDNPDFK